MAFQARKQDGKKVLITQTHAVVLENLEAKFAKEFFFK